MDNENMFQILKDKTICLTRGDIASIVVSAIETDEHQYTFKQGDVVRFNVFVKKKVDNVIIKKDITVEKESQEVTIDLTTSETRIGEVIHKPVEHWYEIVLNPDTNPQTLVCYDEEGEKIFRLYPEGSVQNGN